MNSSVSVDEGEWDWCPVGSTNPISILSEVVSSSVDDPITDANTIDRKDGSVMISEEFVASSESCLSDSQHAISVLQPEPAATSAQGYSTTQEFNDAAQLEILKNNLSIYDDLSEFDDSDSESANSDSTFDGFGANESFEGFGEKQKNEIEGFGKNQSKLEIDKNNEITLVPGMNSSNSLRNSVSAELTNSGVDCSFEGFGFDQSVKCVEDEDMNKSRSKSQYLFTQAVWPELTTPKKKQEVQATNRSSTPAKATVSATKIKAVFDSEDVIGPFCQAIGCSVSWLESGSVKMVKVTNGAVVELTEFAKKIAWERSYVAEWILRLHGRERTSVEITEDDLQKIHMVNKRRKAISVTFSGKYLLKPKLIEFDNETFTLPCEAQFTNGERYSDITPTKVEICKKKNSSTSPGKVKSSSCKVTSPGKVLTSLSKKVSKSAQNSFPVSNKETPNSQGTSLVQFQKKLSVAVSSSGVNSSISDEFSERTPTNKKHSDFDHEMVIDQSPVPDDPMTNLTSKKNSGLKNAISLQSHVNQPSKTSPIVSQDASGFEINIGELAYCSQSVSPIMKTTTAIKTEPPELDHAKAVTGKNMSDVKSSFGQHIIFASKKGRGDIAGKNVTEPVFEVRNNNIGPFCVRDALTVAMLNSPTRKINVTNGMVIELYIFFKERGATLTSLVHKLHQLLCSKVKSDQIHFDMSKIQEVVNTELKKKTDYYLEREFSFNPTKDSLKLESSAVQSPSNSSSLLTQGMKQSQTSAKNSMCKKSDPDQLIMDDLKMSEGKKGTVTRGDIVKLYYAWLQLKNKDKDSVFVIDLLSEVEKLMMAREIEVIRIPVGTLMSSSVKLFEEYQKFRACSQKDALSYLEDDWLEDIQYLVSASKVNQTPVDEISCGSSKKMASKNKVSIPKTSPKSVITPKASIWNESANLENIGEQKIDEWESHTPTPSSIEKTDQFDLNDYPEEKKDSEDIDKVFLPTMMVSSAGTYPAVPVINGNDFMSLTFVYQIEKVVSCRLSSTSEGVVYEYLTQWNSSKRDLTWVMEAEFPPACQFITDFWQSNPKRIMRIESILKLRDVEISGKLIRQYLVVWANHKSESWIQKEHMPKGSHSLLQEYLTSRVDACPISEDKNMHQMEVTSCCSGASYCKDSPDHSADITTTEKRKHSQDLDSDEKFCKSRGDTGHEHSKKRKNYPTNVGDKVILRDAIKIGISKDIVHSTINSIDQTSTTKNDRTSDDKSMDRTSMVKEADELPAVKGAARKSSEEYAVERNAVDMTIEKNTAPAVVDNKGAAEPSVDSKVGQPLVGRDAFESSIDEMLVDNNADEAAVERKDAEVAVDEEADNVALDKDTDSVTVEKNADVEAVNKDADQLSPYKDTNEVASDKFAEVLVHEDAHQANKFKVGNGIKPNDTADYVMADVADDSMMNVTMADDVTDNTIADNLMADVAADEPLTDVNLLGSRTLTAVPIAGAPSGAVAVSCTTLVPTIGSQAIVSQATVSCGSTAPILSSQEKQSAPIKCRSELLDSEEKSSEMCKLKTLPLKSIFGKRKKMSFTEACIAHINPNYPSEPLNGFVRYDPKKQHLKPGVTKGAILAIYDEWRSSRKRARAGSVTKENIASLRTRVRRCLESHNHPYEYDDCLLGVCYSLYLARIKLQSVTEIFAFNDTDCMPTFKSFQKKHNEVLQKYYTTPLTTRENNLPGIVDGVQSNGGAGVGTTLNRESTTVTSKQTQILGEVVGNITKGISDIEQKMSSETFSNSSANKELLELKKTLSVFKNKHQMNLKQIEEIELDAQKEKALVSLKQCGIEKDDLSNMLRMITKHLPACSE